MQILNSQEIMEISGSMTYEEWMQTGFDPDLRPRDNSLEKLWV